MRARDAIDVLARHRGEAVGVCALGMAANEWWAATKSEDSFYMHGAMGFAASFALGLALSLPHVPVWLINADGSLCMNLGCLLTEASQGAKNLKHFVVANGVYQSRAWTSSNGCCPRSRPRTAHHSRSCGLNRRAVSCARRP